MPLVVPRYEARKYDGTNGADLVRWLSGSVDLVSDDGAELVLLVSGEHRRIPAGWWVIAGGAEAATAAFHTEQSPADYVNYWLEIPAQPPQTA